MRALLLTLVAPLLFACSKQDPSVSPNPKTAPTAPDSTVAPPAPAANAQWVCAKDDDCTMSCAKGAVNKKWWDGWNKDGECKDGCAEMNKAVCKSGECVAVDYRSGELRPGCTHK